MEKLSWRRDVRDDGEVLGFTLETHPTKAEVAVVNTQGYWLVSYGSFEQFGSEMHVVDGLRKVSDLLREVGLDVDWDYTEEEDHDMLENGVQVG